MNNNEKMKKVFLGGTCATSTWRTALIPMLNIDYFNPVTDDWTPECYQQELHERETCDYCLYTITTEMEGVYSIAEVADDSNKRPEKTVFCVLEEGFKPKQLRSLEAVAKMVVNNGGQYFKSLQEVADFLNRG